METKDIIRVWISIIVATLIVVLVTLTLPRHTFKPCGIFLPAKKVFNPIASGQVTLFSSDSLIGNYQEVGMIRISRHYSPNNVEQAQQQILDSAKEIAAKAGANGVIVKFFAHSAPGVVSADQAMYVFWGTAVRTHFTPQQAFLPAFFS